MKRKKKAKAAKSPKKAKGLAKPNDAARQVKQKLPGSDQIQEAAARMRIIADPVRFSLLYALSLSPLCVNDLSAISGISQSGTSHQLRLLRTAHFVATRKKGKQVFYRLDDANVRRLIRMAISS